MLTKAFSCSSSSKGRNDPKTEKQSRKDGGKAVPERYIPRFIAQTHPKSSVFTPLRHQSSASRLYSMRACGRWVWACLPRAPLALHLSVLTPSSAAARPEHFGDPTHSVCHEVFNTPSLSPESTTESLLKITSRPSVTRWFLQVRHGSVVSATRFSRGGTKSGRNGQLLGGSYSVENNELQAENNNNNNNKN